MTRKQRRSNLVRAKHIYVTLLRPGCYWMMLRSFSFNFLLRNTCHFARVVRTDSSASGFLNSLKTLMFKVTLEHNTASEALSHLEPCQLTFNVIVVTIGRPILQKKLDWNGRHHFCSFWSNPRSNRLIIFVQTYASTTIRMRIRKWMKETQMFYIAIPHSKFNNRSKLLLKTENV